MKKYSMCILEQNTRNITVRISNARWNRLMELENAYRQERTSCQEGVRESTSDDLG